MVTRFLVLASLLSLTLVPAASYAQVNPQFAEYTDEIEMARSLIRADRKAIVSQGMELSATESGEFWKVYNDYEKDKADLNNRLVKIITDYAAVYGDMSDETASNLLDEVFSYESDLLDLKQKYARQFSKVLPPIKVTRFYQIERKLDAVQDLSIIAEIPLAQ